MKFIDEALITVKAGDGGKGCISFRREKFVPRGGPDGGDGGDGGDVVLVADPSLSTLLDFKYKPRYKAGRGGAGQGKDMHGANADHLMVQTPCGVEVHDADTEELLADLVEPGERFVAARGGKGGKGNAHFKSATNQAPRTTRPPGAGEERRLRLTLKLIADVGLVGLPNAGKSTLISVISAARPKIAEYPFTTLVPNLGVVSAGGGDGFVVADLPGLIRGASMGQGLGHQFLRHVERTRLILHLVDCKSKDPLADVKTIEAELAAFDPALAKKPSIIVITKSDLVTDPAALKKIEGKFKRSGRRAFTISSVSGKGVKELVRTAATRLKELTDKEKTMKQDVKEKWEP